MPSFVITAFFEVEPPGAAPGEDVVAKRWGPGHQFSYFDGRSLTLIVEVVAPDRSCAFETVLSRVESIWELVCGTPLPAPVTVRVQQVVPQAKTLGGSVGRGPDRLMAEAAACRAARLRAAVAALSDLEGHPGAGLPEVAALQP